MPILETPPDPATPPPPPPVKLRTGRYGDLEEHELIHLLGALDDERARARFRESIYISFILCVALAWLICYGPQVLFHQPRLINPADVLKQRDKELTVLNVPKDLPKSTPRKPTKNIADQDHAQQTPKPTLDKKTLDQLQAQRQAAPQPVQQPEQAPAPQQQQPPPAPLTQHPPQQQPIVDAPRPSANRPSFNTPNQTAGDAIRQAAQSALANRGGGGDYGVNAPSARGGGNFGGTEVLSDTMGVDFGPYLRRILGDIKRNWDPLLPEEARYPLNKQGETYIRFTIGKDGKILAMSLDDSTKDVAIDKSCWNAIKAEGQFPPLPTQFPGPNLELRIHFLVNKTPQ